MDDITYCAYADCPLKDCERHLTRLDDRVGARADGFSIADFAPTCRDYIRHVVEEVSKNG